MKRYCVNTPDARPGATRAAAAHPEASHPGSAARAAARLEALCERGIAARTIGRCLGEAMGGAHARVGHDVGCEVLGVPLEQLHRCIRVRQTGRREMSGAALLMEALAECLAELSALGKTWHPVRAREAVQAAVRSRITPAEATQDGGVEAAKQRRRRTAHRRT